ncbi:MAG: hypothetical protein QOJ63_1312 [Solirubrobacteraceae bacterium]|nr:hypothetical protein [Solirubrobacteraceae bacterium]
MPSRGEPGEGRLLALIIATETYSDPTLTKLRAPGSDARDLADVLRDDEIGGFEVETVIDAAADTIRRSVARFCAGAGPRDIALVYLSCHGVLDDRGHLHYAATDTERALLTATAVEALWLNRQLEDCSSRQQILILDCCHSGAFARGTKGESELALRDRFPEARGRVVLTASRATEYAFEGDRVVGEGASAVFTGALVDGLRTGDADRDGDGLITVTELFDYADEAVRSREGRQRPGLWIHAGEGRIVVARNVRGPRIDPKPLPYDLILETQSGRAKVRMGAVGALADILAGSDPGLAMSARECLQQMAEEDLPSVAQAARDVLELHIGADDLVEVPGPPEPAVVDDPVVEPAPVGPPTRGRSSRLIAAVAGWPRFAAVVVIVVLGAVAAAFALGGPADVKVGALYSLHGADDLGPDVLEGVRFAVDYVNGDAHPGSTLALSAGGGLPGLDGAKLKLVPRDLKDDRCAVKPAVDQLVDRDHVAALVGAGQSTFTFQALVAAHEHKMPLVNDISSAPSLTTATPDPPSARGACGILGDPRPSEWFFRVGPSDTVAARVFLSLIRAASQGGGVRVHKVAILHENNDIFGNAGAAVTKTLAKAAGMDVQEFRYRTVLGTSTSHSLSCGSAKEHKVVKQLGVQVGKIKRWHPDVVLALSYEPDAVAIVQTMHDRRYEPPAMLAFGTGFATATFAASAKAGNPSCGLRGANPAGIIVRTSGSADERSRDPTTASVATAFKKRYGHAMNSRAAGGFTAMLTLAQAIDDAGSTDPEKIRARLATLEVPRGSTILPWAGIKFDGDGENHRARVVLQVVGGTTRRTIDPTNVHTARAIFKPVTWGR